jgi:hypothetical protein
MNTSAELRLAQLINLPPLDSYGRWNGSCIAPHSIPADRNAVQQLSDISDRAGYLRGGSMLVGPLLGAHIAFGDAWDGLEVTFDDASPWFSINKTTRSAVFGKAGTNGAVITEGLFHVYGDAIFDHTVTAAKLIAGEIFTHFMTADNIQVGFVDPDTGLFTGVRLGAGGLGGFNEDRLRAGFDLGTGIFETRGIGDYGSLYDFVKMYDAGIEISGMGDRDPLAFTLWQSDPANPKDFIVTRHIGVDVDVNGFVFYNLESNIPPRITLCDTDKEIPFGYFGPGEMHIWDNTHAQGFYNLVMPEGVFIGTPYPSTVPIYFLNGAGALTLMPNDIIVLGSPTAPDMTATIPAAPTKGMQWYNTATDRWQTWNGTNWQYPTMNNV